MNNATSVKIKPLTPLWTGNAEGKGIEVRETGILGSLRWWYEALLRGLGAYACDTTSDKHCELKPSQGKPVEEQVKEQLCLACQLFGCTGYSRRFRLMISNGGGTGQPREVKLKNSTKQHRGWRIPDKVASAFTMTFLPMRGGALTDFENATIYYTLKIIESYGALGAKTSQGQGVVQVIDWDGLESVAEAEDWIKEVSKQPTRPDRKPIDPPDLSNLVGATITFDTNTTPGSWWNKIPLNGLESFNMGNNPSWVPSAPSVRAHLRGWLRDPSNIPNLDENLQQERHRIMGTINHPIGPKGSEIFVTHLYRSNADNLWSMRIFGFLPRNGNAVDQALRALLRDEKVLADEVKAALGDISVGAISYPESMDVLLTDMKEK